MKRMLPAAIASSMLVLALPGMASAHHGKRHHRGHHANSHQRARHARLIKFGAASVPASPSGSTTPTTPVTPSGEAAGTVTSFTNGVLTITLTDGSVVSGKVTEETELQCPSATQPSTPTGGGDQSGGDDQSGSGGGDHGGSSIASQPGALQHDDSQGSEGEDANDDDNQESCTTAALVPGAKVGEAELSVSSAGALWHKVELI